MSETDLLEQMRQRIAEGGKPKVSKKAWTAPVREDFALGRVLAFDQTLTKTGFSLVVHDNASLRVAEANLLLPEVDKSLKGFEQTFARAAWLDLRLPMLMALLAPQVDVVVHEMPAVQGYRTESSLMAAQCVRRAARGAVGGVPVAMVSNQTMRKVLNAPEQRFEKKYVGQAVDALIPAEQRTAKRWNQDVHDSVGLALTYLYQKAHP